MTTTKTKPKIELKLAHPNLTWLHRAGIAGLYLTLKQLEKIYPEIDNREGNLSWNLTNQTIELSWEGQDLTVLDWLLKQSFQISPDGLIAFTALNPSGMDTQSLISIHQGIRGTFLQHTSVYKHSGNVSESLQIDEGSPEVVVQYQKTKFYAHQTFAQKLCNNKGNLSTTPIAIAGWLYPGAVVRHNAFSSQTAIEEEPQLAFALLFAPITCQYFLLRSQLRDKRSQYAIVIPEITDLEIFAKTRKHLQNAYEIKGAYKSYCRSSFGDAALTFLTLSKTSDLTRKTNRCQVITMGTVSWSSQQKTRTDIHIVEVTDKITEDYELCAECFPDSVIEGKDGGFIPPSFAREIIANNLATNKPWWFNFSTIINSGELFKRICYEKGGLHNMIYKAQWDEEAQKLFVISCHQALRQTYKQIYDRSKDKGEVANIERENEKIRTSLGRCKNAETFRQFITDFWSRAGKNEILQNNWQQLLPLITDEKQWKIARDLALLALASYKGKNEQSEEVYD